MFQSQQVMGIPPKDYYNSKSSLQITETLYTKNTRLTTNADLFDQILSFDSHISSLKHNKWNRKE